MKKRRKIVLLALLGVGILALIAPAYDDSATAELRFLNGFEWADMSVEENLRFVQGFILGATSTEAAFETRNWQRAMSLYNVSDVGLMRAITEYYYYTEQLAVPVVAVIYNKLIEARQGGF